MKQPLSPSGSAARWTWQSINDFLVIVNGQRSMVVYLVCLVCLVCSVGRNKSS